MTTGCAGEGIKRERTKARSWLTCAMLVMELDDELQTLSYSLRNAIHDSTPSLGTELLRSLDAVIRDVNIEDNDDDDSDRRRARG